jgi:hypothetical protein
VVPHSYGDGKQASEGVVLGMVPGLANAMVGRALDVIFQDVWRRGTAHLKARDFCNPQPEIPIFWNTAAFSNIAPVQLYSGILHNCEEGS